MLFVNVSEGINPKATAGKVVLDSIGQDEIDAYREYRNDHISSPDDADIRSELIADAYGDFLL